MKVCWKREWGGEGEWERKGGKIRRWSSEMI